MQESKPFYKETSTKIFLTDIYFCLISNFVVDFHEGSGSENVNSFLAVQNLNMALKKAKILKHIG